MDAECTERKQQGEIASHAGVETGCSSARFDRREWLILSFLVLSMVAQMWISIRQLSVTTDEIEHLRAGYRYLKCGDFGWSPEHPPLVKMIAALPLLASHVNDPIASACGLPNSPELMFRYGHTFTFTNSQSMLVRARMAVSVFAILLLLTTYFFARELFGVPVAMFAATLIAYEPNLLGHGSLVTTDAGATFGYLFATFALWRYLKRPTALRVSVLGLALGLALVTKYSTILLIPLLPVLTILVGLVSTEDGGKKWIPLRLGGVAAAMLIGVGVLWACYGFHYLATPNAAPVRSSHDTDITRAAPATRVMLGIERSHILPQAYLIGLQDAMGLQGATGGSGTGHPAFLLGQNYLGGRWYYFPAAIAIKLTVALLFSVLLSFAARQLWRERRRELLFLLLPVLLFMLVSARTGINIGIRHVLPIVPLLAIFGAAGVCNLKWTRKAVLWTVGILVFGSVATCLHAFPNYISYGNELWGGSGSVYKYLSDSNADWGQAQIMARKYIEQTKPSSCITIRFGSNVEYGTPCADISPLNEHEIALPRHYSGTIVVSSDVVNGIENGVANVGSWSRINATKIFKGLSPKAKIGGSALLVYEGEFDLSPIIADQYVARIGKTVHEPAEVAEQAKRALEIDPSNLLGHYRLCQADGYLGDFEGAKTECTTTYRMMKSNPYVSSIEKHHLLQSLIANGMVQPEVTAP